MAPALSPAPVSTSPTTRPKYLSGLRSTNVTGPSPTRAASPSRAATAWTRSGPHAPAISGASMPRSRTRVITSWPSQRWISTSTVSPSTTFTRWARQAPASALRGPTPEWPTKLAGTGVSATTALPARGAPWSRSTSICADVGQRSAPASRPAPGTWAAGQCAGSGIVTGSILPSGTVVMGGS